MDYASSSIGWLLPVWIVGAPLIAGIVMRFSTPKAVRSTTQRYPTSPAIATPVLRRDSGAMAA